VNYMEAAQHIEKTLGFYNVSVAPQNLNRHSRPSRLLKRKGLPAEAVVWAWNYNKDGSIHWIGAFIQNIWLDHHALSPEEVFRSEPMWSVRGNEYTFFYLS